MKLIASARFEPGLLVLVVLVIVLGFFASSGISPNQSNPDLETEIRGFVQDVLGN